MERLVPPLAKVSAWCCLGDGCDRAKRFFLLLCFSVMAPELVLSLPPSDMKFVWRARRSSVMGLLELFNERGHGVMLLSVLASGGCCVVIGL